MNKEEFNYLLSQIHNKDSDALSQLINFYKVRIIAHIASRFGKYIAEEVCQIFFMNLLQKQSTEQYIHYPTSWVMHCCDNLAINLIKKESKEINTDEISGESLDFQKELYGDLYDALTKLNEKQRAIITMIYFEGYTAKETAIELNINYATVRQIHRRTIKELKSLL